MAAVVQKHALDELKVGVAVVGLVVVELQVLLLHHLLDGLGDGAGVLEGL